MIYHNLRKVNDLAKVFGEFYSDKMNIQEVAKKAGVSIATVSRVINKTAKVNEETKKRVLDAVSELGYLPNAMAKSLKTNSSLKLTGIVCTDVTDFYYARALSALERELRKRGFETLLACTGNDIEMRHKAIYGMLDKSVDAIILVGSIFAEKNPEHIKHAASLVPVFIINGIVNVPNTYSVYCDDFNAMSHCCQKLSNDGRKNILYIYDSDSYSGIQKLNGFNSSKEKLNFKSSVVKCEKHALVSDTEQNITKALTENPDTDAIIASEDYLAVIAQNCVIKSGKISPKDVAVIGYNNSLMAEISNPKLTSLDNRIEEICEKAVENLALVLNGKSAPVTEAVDYKLVRRESF